MTYRPGDLLIATQELGLWQDCNGYVARFYITYVPTKEPGVHIETVGEHPYRYSYVLTSRGLGWVYTEWLERRL